MFGGGIPLVAILLLVGAWAIDSAVSGDRVIRNVQAGETDLGGLTRDEVEALAADLSNDLIGQPATLTVGSLEFDTDPFSLGARVDGEALATAALDARRGGSVLTAPFRWVGTFFGDETITIPYEVDDEVAEATTLTLVGDILDEALEPTIELRGDRLVAVPGAEGAQVEDGALAAALPAVMAAGPPYDVAIELIPLRPDLDVADLEAVATQANTVTANDVIIEVLGAQATVSSSMLRSWITLDSDGPSPTWAIDGASAIAELRPMFPALGSADQQARFDIVDGAPIILPASETVLCCAEDTPGRIKAGLLSAGAPSGDEEQEPTTIELAPQLSGSQEGVAELEALGIIEEISTFTTNHNCCEGRVTNIQLMADIVRGHVIRPGQRFDLNEVVGRRTAERGFVPAGAIASGVVEAQVGGGVSQFTTTIFNAAFFGGLDFIEYQSHSLYFSRYPRGREATISWPKPDFIIENNTPYGVLVWPTYTDRSISVTFYSTRNIDVACVMSDGSLVEGPDGCDSAVRRSAQGACSRYTTVRHRTFADGTTSEDSVFAVYRPGEGLDCAGNSTVPTTAPPDTTPEETVPEETTPEETTPTTVPTPPSSDETPPSSEG